MGRYARAVLFVGLGVAAIGVPFVANRLSYMQRLHEAAESHSILLAGDSTLAKAPSEHRFELARIIQKYGLDKGELSEIEAARFLDKLASDFILNLNAKRHIREKQASDYGALLLMLSRNLRMRPGEKWTSDTGLGIDTLSRRFHEQNIAPLNEEIKKMNASQGSVFGAMESAGRYAQIMHEYRILLSARETLISNPAFTGVILANAK